MGQCVLDIASSYRVNPTKQNCASIIQTSTRVERRVNNIVETTKKDIFSASVLTPMHVADVTLPIVQ